MTTTAERKAALQMFAASAVVGLLLVGVALPALAVVGVLTNTGNTSFQSIPDALTRPPLPQQTVLLAADGTRLATLFYQDRIEVKIDEIAPVMQDAIVAIEDSRFYQHAGFDLRGTLRALVSTLSGSRVEGGSTITQQYVKNILVASAKSDSEAAAATARTPARKLKELRYSLAVERLMTKQQILEGYLNIAYFGSGAYGVESAARRYFSKSAAQLNLSESALLAGLVQQPYRYDPTRYPERAQGRRDNVLRRMVELGLIDQAAADKAAAVSVAKLLNPSEHSNGCTSAVAPFFCDYVVQTIRSSPAFGDTLAERDAMLRQGGLTITTTLDLKAQGSAQKAMKKYLPAKDPSGKAAAISMVEPGTGNILAMAENRAWGTSGPGKTTYNYNVGRSMGGTIGMQAGSTFKIFVLAAAIEQGISSSLKIPSPAAKTFTNFANCTNGDLFPEYTVHNSTRSGNFNMREGTAYSVNTYFMTLEEMTGLCRPVEIAEAAGVRLGTGGKLNIVPSFVLGANEVTPLGVANAYATFAAHGLYCAPRVITSAVDRWGNHLPIGETSCTQIIDREVADGVTSMLREVTDGPLPGRTGGRMSFEKPSAGKTGTTNDSAAVWFTGYTPNLAAAVWVGDPRGGSKYPLKDITINGVYYEQVFGSLLPGPIWRFAMRGALAGQDAVQFDLRLPNSVTGPKPTVEPEPCLTADPADPAYEPCPSPTASSDPASG